MDIKKYLNKLYGKVTKGYGILTLKEALKRCSVVFDELPVLIDVVSFHSGYGLVHDIHNICDIDNVELLYNLEVLSIEGDDDESDFIVIKVDGGTDIIADLVDLLNSLDENPMDFGGDVTTK